jgi:hypothetical protein
MIITGAMLPFLWYATTNSSSSGDGSGGGINGPVLTGGNVALFDSATGGPCFGASDFLLGVPGTAVMGGFALPDMMDARSNSVPIKLTRVGQFEDPFKWCKLKCIAMQTL